VLSGAGGSVAYAASTASQPHSGSIPSSGPVAGAMGFSGRATSGGFSGGTTSDSQLAALLKATTTRWAAATIGAQSAAPLQLASGRAVMSIGGFTGSDNAPTLVQFKAWVAAGEIRYFIAGGQGQGGGPGGNAGSASEITSWVESTFTSTTVGGVSVYDLTSSTS
jgi:hypothetical protein